MSKSFVTADLRGLNRLITNLKSGKYVDVGVLEGTTYDNGQTVAYIGAVHEFGTDIAGRGNNVTIPERSFIKMPLETKSKEIENYAGKNLQNNLEKGNIDKIFMDIGIAADVQIQEAFETGGFGKWQALEQSTIDGKKGGNAILIDQGTLRKSISYAVGGGK